jgi:serine/threonine-protein kinase
MPDDTVPTINSLEDRLFTWQEAREQGRDLPAEELCRDCPELLPELERRLDILRKVENLLTLDDTANTLAYTPNETPLPGDTPPMPPGYEWRGKIGEGGMGVVYHVWETNPGRHVALKMIRAGEFASPRDLARFQFEGEATARLEHPNIVTVYNVGKFAGQPYLALRWIDGTSLRERLASGPLPPRDAAHLLEKVARAIHYAHQSGILHRDLKPGNILLDRANEPYVADFGLARRIDSDETRTEFGEVVGTPSYMAPEQVCSEKPSTAIDIWALGVVLYECLTGKRPFDGRTTIETLKRIPDSEPAPPRTLNSAIPADLEAICLKCLEKDPAQRYSSALALADDLERYRLGQAVSAQPPGFWDWLALMLRTRPEPNLKYSWRASIVGGAVILLTHVAIFGLIQANGPALGVWGIHLLNTAVVGFVFWLFMLRRFRDVPVTERHSLVIASGVMLATLGLLAAYVPLALSGSARTALPMYPGLCAVSGVGLFILGSTNWARFFPIGLGMIALAPVMAWWPEASPLMYAVLFSGILWYWSYAKKVNFVDRAE